MANDLISLSKKNAEIEQYQFHENEIYSKITLFNLHINFISLKTTTINL